MNWTDKDRFSRGIIGLALLCGMALAPMTALAQEEVLEEENTEKDKIKKDEEATNAVQDSLVGPDSFTNPKVTQDRKSDAPIPLKRFGKSSAVRWQLGLSGRFQMRNNLDFRELDNASQQSALDTDDRVSFGSTQLTAGFNLKINDEASLNVGLVNNGLWGGGIFSDLAADNSIVLNKAYFDWTVINVPGFKLTTRTGRQFFSIGGAKRDYFFRDVVDGLTINADMGAGGRIRVLALDIVGAQVRPDEVDFFTRGATGSSGQNFNGDTNTYRTGLIYENTKLVSGLELRAFGFYADIGSGQTGKSSGVDLSYGGQLGNFSDNDYNFMLGTRIGYFFENDLKTMKIGGYGEFARSGGLDRKATVYGLRDIDAGGNAFGVGALADLKLGSLSLDVGFEFFRADGPVYGNDGIQGNSGFVSMKGNHAGGLAMDDTAGWHPTAYVASSKGLEVTPQEQQRKSGTQTIHAEVGVGLIDTLQLSLNMWHFVDTGATFLAEEDIATTSQDLPFGYSQADLEAQQRLGDTLGTELGAGLTYLASDLVSAYVQGAMFIPGDFYKREITRSGGTALGSTNPQNMWVVTMGTTLQWK